MASSQKTLPNHRYRRGTSLCHGDTTMRYSLSAQTAFLAWQEFRTLPQRCHGSVVCLVPNLG